jgi:hypothetical protein
VKRWSVTAGATVAIATPLWAILYVLTPQAPLTGAETIVVVGAAGAAVLLARAVGSRLARWRRR